MNALRCSLCSNMGPEKVDELCCLYALGELSPEEILRVRGHLLECPRCRSLVEEFERIMLFDIPSVSVLRSEGTVPEDPESVDPTKLLERVREKARSVPEEYDPEAKWKAGVECALPLPRPVRRLRALRFAALAAGWLIAMLLIPYRGSFRQKQKTAGVPETRAIEQRGQALAARAAELSRRLQAADATVKSLEAELARSSERGRIAQSQMERIQLRNQDLNGSNSDLHAQLHQQEELIAQEQAQLQLTRDSLNAELAAKNALQEQLEDVNSRLDKQRQEVARLVRVAATVPAAYPVSESKVSEGEAREILGARDLHIVDVYDVDDSGAASHAYGRIYYVNHRVLVFYAFDLSGLEKNHKLVAFQAWGFRQPRSSKVESLGLFYLDNATLNRWALRISNPEVLSRIDTLFVTVEPPGGSRFPKGRRLLMASLAGPPNHP